MNKGLTVFMLMVLLLSSHPIFSQADLENSSLKMDETVYDALPESEQLLIDSCLIKYNESIHDTSKLKYLRYIIEKSLSDGVWTFYNSRLHELVKDKMAKNNSKEEERFYTIYFAETLNNFGVEYNARGSVEVAILYHQKSLKIREELNYKPGIANSYANIGRVHLWQKNLGIASKFFNQSLTIFLEIKDSLNIAKSYNYIGYIAKLKGNNEEALSYYGMSLKIRRSINNKNGEAQSLNYIGEILEESGALDSALLYYNQALEIDYEIGEKNGAAIGLQSLGRVYLKQGQLKKAEKSIVSALVVAEEIGYPGHIRDASEVLADIYVRKGDWKKAFTMYRKYVEMRDSLENRENEKALIQQELKYGYEKKQLADSLQFLEKEKIKTLQIEKQDASIKTQQTQIYASIGAIIMMVLLSVFIYKNLRTQKTTNLIIQEQKRNVEEKNQQITDSITYAKRIQSAILPPDKVVKEHLKESFILYKPKDIVAGDFYWLEPKGGTILFAAADCTGHGVPGAMVSVICNNGLNRSVRENGLTDPGEILDKTREIVIQEFEKSEDEVKDGMDIALCSLEGNQLAYAGANNPLWIIRNGEIIETKANKQPIGRFDNMLPYTTHTFELEKGDTIYIFSDGYVDQFGGEKGKKFKAKAFRTLLLSIQDKPMKEQEKIIGETFEAWRGSLEQIDDVCVIGVRV